MIRREEWRMTTARARRQVLRTALFLGLLATCRPTAVGAQEAPGPAEEFAAWNVTVGWEDGSTWA